MYRNSPDGICGHEDCGQMSAWYDMSAMGFYPVNPCGGEYEFGAPLFPEVTLNLQNGKTFTVLCHYEQDKESLHHYNCHSERSEEYLPQTYHLNGKRIKGTTITHRDIMNGGVLEFE